MTDDILAYSVRVGVGVVLLSASAGKAGSFALFRRTVRGLGVPGQYSGVVAAAFLGLEAASALYQVSGAAWSIADGLVLVVVIALLSASLWAIVTGRDLVCACFGRPENKLGSDTLPLAATLVAAQIGYLAFGHAEGYSAPAIAGRLAGAALGICIVTCALWVRVAPTLFRIVVERRHIAQSVLS